MSEALWFAFGAMVGAPAGMFLLALLAINRPDPEDRAERELDQEAAE